MAAAMGTAGKQQQLWGGPVGDSSGSSSGEVPSCRSSGEMSAGGGSSIAVAVNCRSSKTVGQQQGGAGGKRQQQVGRCWFVAAASLRWRWRRQQ